MRLFDTHSHLLDEAFDNDRNKLCSRLPESGIAYLLEASTRAKDSARVLSLAENYPYIYAALGTHPHDADGMDENDIPRLSADLKHQKAVAVGEIGLDYHYDFSPRSVQRYWFERQLALANELELPAVLHVREADEDALSILRANRDGLTGVMHCFSGSYETAKLCLDMGLYIAFGGALTFKNAKRNVEIAGKLPLDRLLIETDCPYMTPVPCRGERNDPSFVRLVAERLAEIKRISVEECSEITLQNGLRLFAITHSH